MYSNSNAYLGGNSARPGPPQYGQSSFSQPVQQQQQQSNAFAPQPTGFAGAPLQQQYTGYPGQIPQQSFQTPQQQSQYTGFPPQNQALQQQAFQAGQPPQQPVTPQKTGQTSSQIAQSFASAPLQQAPAPKATASTTKIPKIRLSFLTATDQAKFEQLFKSAVGDEQALDGNRIMTIRQDGADEPYRGEGQGLADSIEASGDRSYANMV